MPLSFAVRFAASQRWADPLAKWLQPLIKRAVSAPPVHDLLDGVWLGAPLHPPLTDVPIGAWTTALLLDTGSALSGNGELGAAADRALAVGTIAAVPTALTVAMWLPLLSAAPRAHTSPSRTAGSNGGDFHSSRGSTGWTS